MKIKLLGIDLAKNIFQVCALNQANKVVFNRKVKRDKLSSLIANTPPTIVAMESCSSAHFWGRLFSQQGHQVILIPAQHVKPFVHGGKSDSHDALAICEAAQRPSIHSVPIKTIEQQDMQLLHRLRQRHIQHSTSLANQIRSLSREYGLIFPLGINKLIALIPAALEDASNELSTIARRALFDHYQELLHARKSATELLKQIQQLAAQHPDFEALKVVPGIGDLTASAYIASVGNGHQFKRGREVSAWLGMVPRQYGTGGKMQLGGITKNGDRYLRSLLIHGARAAISRSSKNCPPLKAWVEPIIARRGYNKAVVALANKLCRIAWVIVAKGEPFDLKRAFKPAT